MKAIIWSLFGIYVIDTNIILGYFRYGGMTTKTVKLSRFIKCLKKQCKIYKRTISADLAEDNHLFKTGYL